MRCMARVLRGGTGSSGGRRSGGRGFAASKSNTGFGRAGRDAALGAHLFGPGGRTRRLCAGAPAAKSRGTRAGEWRLAPSLRRACAFREMLTRLRFPGAVSRKRRELNSRTRAASQSRISLARVGFQIGHPSPALPPRRSQTVERASRARAHSAEVEMAPSAEEHDPELKVEFRRELRKGFRDLRSDARGAPRAMRHTPFFSPSGPRPRSPSVCVGTHPDPPRRHPLAPQRGRIFSSIPRAKRSPRRSLDPTSSSPKVRAAPRANPNTRVATPRHDACLFKPRPRRRPPRASPSLETGTETEPGTETGTHAFPTSPRPARSAARSQARPRAQRGRHHLRRDRRFRGGDGEAPRPQRRRRVSPPRVLRSTLRRLRERMGPAVASRGRPRIVPLGNPRKPSVALLRGGARVRVHERRHGHAGEGATSGAAHSARRARRPRGEPRRGGRHSDGATDGSQHQTHGEDSQAQDQGGRARHRASFGVEPPRRLRNSWRTSSPSLSSSRTATRDWNSPRRTRRIDRRRWSSAKSRRSNTWSAPRSSCTWTSRGGARSWRRTAARRGRCRTAKRRPSRRRAR